MSGLERICLPALLVLALAGNGRAEITFWKIGGGGLSWEGGDTSRVMVLVDSRTNALAPIYFEPNENILLSVSGWSELRTPRELGYLDGHQPRLWLNDGTNVNLTSYYDSPLFVDGERGTYNTARFGWWTIDLGVPVPASRFGFLTPTRGFRSDGVPLNQDPVPAFEISVAEESDPLVEERGYHRLPILVANVQENFAPEVEIEFPPQYVRFVRYNRNRSVIDDQRTTDSNTVRGTIAEFVLYGRGVPKRALYRTRITGLGREVNFGRIFWSATSLRRSGEETVEAAEARAWVEVEARSGRDDDPNMYHEYTDSGKEFPVSRQRYEHELRLPETEGILQLDQRPGIRASITYDSENWSFWSSPIKEPGTRLDLRNGSFLQMQITLQSRATDEWVRLDSLWVEVSPPLADRVLGEVARLQEMQPRSGFTQVELGRRELFAYDLMASFASSEQGGFDGVRVRTGSRPRFARLEMGEPLEEVEAREVIEEDDGLVVRLPEKITRARNRPVRLVFETQVFLHATTFEGEVLDTDEESLPQPVQAGDAGRAIGTSSLRVLSGSGQEPSVIQGLAFSTSVLTPNGDGVHERLEIAYELFLLPDPVPVELNVYDLQGRRRARIEVGAQGAGPQRASWDGRDEAGALLPPGLYLVSVDLRAELKTVRHLRPLGLAY